MIRLYLRLSTALARYDGHLIALLAVCAALMGMVLAIDLGVAK